MKIGGVVSTTGSKACFLRITSSWMSKREEENRKGSSMRLKELMRTLCSKNTEGEFVEPSLSVCIPFSLVKASKSSGTDRIEVPQGELVLSLVQP